MNMNISIKQSELTGRDLDIAIAKLAGYTVEKISRNSWTLYSPNGVFSWTDNWTEDEAWDFAPAFSESYEAFKALEADYDYVTVVHKELQPDGESVRIYDVYLCPEDDPDGRFFGTDPDGRTAWLRAYVAMKTAISLLFVAAFAYAVIDAVT